MAKQVVETYSFSTSGKTITLGDFSGSDPVVLDRLYLITDVTTNKILYNFADSTVASATISSNNVITLSTLQGGESNSDNLQIIYDAKSTDPQYEIPIVTGLLVSAPLVGQTVIASTGTAVQLNGGTSQVLTNGIIISAPASNAAAISVGGSGVNNTTGGTGNGYLLVPGASISFAMVNTNDLWINGTSGDYVSWAGS